MRKRLMGILVVSAIVAGACGSSTTPTTTSAPTTTTSTSTTALESPSPGTSGTPIPAALDLTGTTYEAALAKKQGGKITLAEWQYPDTINPYYAMYETDIEVSD